MLNNNYMNEIDKLRKNNANLDYLLAKENERKRINEGLELEERKYEYNQIENFWKMHNEINKERMNKERRLLEYNYDLKNDITRLQNEQFLELKKIKNEKNLQLQNLDNNHLLHIKKLENDSKNIDNENITQIKKLKNKIKMNDYNYNLEKLKIENEHKNNIKNSEITNNKIIQNINQNKEFIKRNSELNIMKINNDKELEEKKINNELEIKKLEINYKYDEKIYQEEKKKQFILKIQNLEKEQMETQINLMLSQILLNKIQDLNN